MKHETINDEELACQAQAGSLSSFEDLVYRYEGAVFRYLAHSCRNEADARDLTQITFLTAYRSLHRFRPDNRFAPWLFTIARNKFIDHHRAARPIADLEAIPEPSDPRDPARLLEEHETSESIWAWARGLLVSEQFTALWLRYQQDMSIKEVARTLKRTQTSVKVLLFRARQALILKAPLCPVRAVASPLSQPASSSGERPGSSPHPWDNLRRPTTLSAKVGAIDPIKAGGSQPCL